MDQPQSWQNKQSCSFKSFHKKVDARKQKHSQYSPSEVDPDEANEGIEILSKNRERLNSSVIRSNKHRTSQFINYNRNQESAISSNYYLCQTIIDEDKQRDHNGKYNHYKLILQGQINGKMRCQRDFIRMKVKLRQGIIHTQLLWDVFHNKNELESILKVSFI